MSNIFFHFRGKLNEFEGIHYLFFPQDYSIQGFEARPWKPGKPHHTDLFGDGSLSIQMQNL